MRCRNQPCSGLERAGGGGIAVRDDGSGPQARVVGRQCAERSRRGSDGRRRTAASSGVGPAPTRGAGKLRDADRGRRAMSGPAPRPEILTIHPYVAGEAELPGANRTLKLSSNEGAFGVPPSARAAIAEAAAEAYRYPDGGAARLCAALGKRWGLDPRRIVCGAGSDDL